MSKVEIEMELGGFKLDSFKLRIKADREDIPRINGEIGKQFMSFMQPPVGLLEDPPRKPVTATIVSPTENSASAGSSRGKIGRRAKGGTGAGPAVQPIEYRHDPSKWGMPKQKWKAGQKVLWLMYVIKNEAGAAELTAAQIAETFNTHFKQFGGLKRTSMPSILTSLKTSEPALMMDDSAKTPNTWFLSEQGTKAAEILVQEAKTSEATLLPNE